MTEKIRPERVLAAALAFSLEEGALVLGIGRSMMFDLAGSGEIKTFKCGRRRLVSRSALEAFVAKQERKSA